jgi:hypothetical protein
MVEPEKPFSGPAGPSDGPEAQEAPAMSDEQEAEAARNQNRFDIRRLIGGLFLLYGLILLLLGIFGSHASKTKAAGVNINLWTGIGMLVFGGLMVFWALSRPVAPDPPEGRGKGSGRIRRAPAT